MLLVIDVEMASELLNDLNSAMCSAKLVVELIEPVRVLASDLISDPVEAIESVKDRNSDVC